MALWYRYPAALRWGPRCVSAPREVAAAVRILCRVPARPIPLPSLPSGLDTPGVVVFVDRVWSNLERLQRDLDARGIALRPHVKTHKSVRIARMQLEAGAAGLTVGTLGEAEVLASAGLRDLFLAYPALGRGREGDTAARRPRDGRPGGRRRLRRGRGAAGGGGGRRPTAAAGAGGGGLGRPPDRRGVAGPGGRGRARGGRGGPRGRGRVHPRRATATGRRPRARRGSTRSPRSRPPPRRWRPRGSRCAP